MVRGMRRSALLFVVWWTLCVPFHSARADGRLYPDLAVAPTLQTGTLKGSQAVTVHAASGCNCSDLRLYVFQEFSLPCHTSGGSAQNCSWRKLSGTFADDKRSVQFNLTFAGDYEPRAYNCTCNGHQKCRGGCKGQILSRTAGVSTDVSRWNITIIPMQQPSEALELLVSISRQFFGPDELKVYYFPLLTIYTCMPNEHNGDLNDCDPHCSNRSKEYPFEFQPDETFHMNFTNIQKPGRYEVRVQPRGTLNCKGNHASCPTRCSIVDIKHRTGYSAHPFPGQSQSGKATYIVIGVAAGFSVAVFLLCYVYRSRRNILPTWPRTIDRTLVLEETVTVIIFYRGGGDEFNHQLTELKRYLHSHGVNTVDFQDASMRELLHRNPTVWDVLGLENYRDARILIVSAGAAAEAATPPYRYLTQVYDNVVRQLRNTPIGFDYQRLFVATLGKAPGPEVASLVEGRRYGPHDRDLLVEHLLTRVDGPRPPCPPTATLATC